MHATAVHPLLIATSLVLAACAPTPQAESTPSSSEAAAMSSGRVTDMNTFGAFIASRPTPDAFAAKYPGVVLILPGMIATKELRSDNSRYFANLDAEGRITDGLFQ